MISRGNDRDGEKITVQRERDFSLNGTASDVAVG